jgi:hypothetical protein
MKTKDKRPVPERCGNCRHWLKSGDSNESELIGECKRYPPSFQNIEGETQQVSPLTGALDVCGEFKLRIDA